MKKRKILILLTLSMSLILVACQSHSKIDTDKIQEKIAKEHSKFKKEQSESSSSNAKTEKSTEAQNSDSSKKAKGLPKDANHAKTDKIYATGDAKVYYSNENDGFEAQISDFKGYNQDKVKKILGKPDSISTDQNAIQNGFKEKELENINELINSGSLTEEQGKAFYAVAVDLAQTTKINHSSHYILFSYQGGKVQLIFNGDSDLYYMTPNSKYLYFK